MNLFSQLPSNISIDNNLYAINTGFRKGIEFEGLFKQNLEDEEFRNKALEIYYPIIPYNIDEAIQAMLWFYRCGKEPKVDIEATESKEDIYSFEYDADYIYSAFLDQYNIDLQEQDELHWWKFKAMFKALKEDNEISKIMSYRAMKIDNKMSKEQQAYYRKLKSTYKIPQDEEKVKANESLADILRRGGSLTELK